MTSIVSSNITDIRVKAGLIAQSGDDPIAAQLSERVNKSTVALTYYVNSTSGSDTNDGLTSGTAFKTIQHAIDSLPQVINHTVTINISSGTYNETVNINGFLGYGTLILNGGTSLTTAVNYIVGSISMLNSFIPINITGLTCNSTSTTSISITYCNYVKLLYCIATASSSFFGVFASRNSSIMVSNCTLSNKATAIKGSYNAHIISDSNSGAANTIVLAVDYGSVIAQAGTQPTGTTATSVTYGGVIR